MMKNNGILGLGFELGDSIFDVLDIGHFVSIVNTEAELMDELDSMFLSYRKFELKKAFLALLPDLFTILAHELAIADVPGIYTQMRRNLLGSENHIEDKQLLTFLNELQSDFDAEIERYREGDIDLNPLGPHAFMIQERDDIDDIRSSAMPVKFTSAQREAARKEVLADPRANSKAPVVCYHGGRFGDHLVFYLKMIHRRSVFMTSIIEFCSSCLWINQSIEAFRMGGKILNFEPGAEGVILRYIASEGLNFRLRGEYTGPDLGSGEQNTGRTISHENSDFSFPMVPEFVPHLRVHHDVQPDDSGIYRLSSGMDEGKKVLEVSNRTSKRLQIKSSDEDIITVRAFRENFDTHIVEVPARFFTRKVAFTLLDD